MFDIWKKDLLFSLKKFFIIKNNTRFFVIKISLFFISINILFYWLAMLLAFPELIFGASKVEYFLLQFPVGILGGIFDSFSLLITIFIIKKALNSNSRLSYILHLSIDFLLAIVATFWILFVFSFSGWIISQLSFYPEGLIDRTIIYEERLMSAINNPKGEEEIKNIFFGIMMGCSAMLPTSFHLYLFIRSFISYLLKSK